MINLFAMLLMLVSSTEHQSHERTIGGFVDLNKIVASDGTVYSILNISIPQASSKCKMSREWHDRAMNNIVPKFIGKKIRQTREGPIIDGLAYKGWLLNNGYALPHDGIDNKLDVFCFAK